MAKRLAAEALLTKLGLSSEKLPEVKSALRIAEVPFPDNDDAENSLRHSSHVLDQKYVSEQLSPVSTSLSSAVINSLMPLKDVKSKVLYNKQNPRSYSSMNLSMNEMHNFMQNHYTSSTSSRLSLVSSSSSS
ncbi:unnamed protein product, partial [Trichobilharzia regenti]